MVRMRSPVQSRTSAPGLFIKPQVREIATLAQLVERVTRNDKVPGSIPGGGSKIWRQRISSGTVHTVPSDLRQDAAGPHQNYMIWEDITPLARNEWICLVTSTENPPRERKHVLNESCVHDFPRQERTPCCWAGCMHRTDKALSPSQKWVRDRSSNPFAILAS
jgi:hypothetical protein